jgi:hypothetical protein
MKRAFIIAIVTFWTIQVFGQSNTFPATGNVGIGTLAPAYPLQINSNDTKIQLGNNTLFSGPFLNLYNSTTTSAPMITLAVAKTNYMNGSNYYIKQNWAALYGNDLTEGLFLTANLNRYMPNGICILNSGNVGIGTTTPRNYLDVAGKVSIGTACPTTGSGLELYHYVSTNTSYINSYNRTTSTYLPLYFSASTYYFNNGNVGIGTTNPTEKLTVNGNIKAERVDIVSDVPASDYVFEKEYNLRSLDQVEQFVKENKHLPEVPSAAEFKENGYSVGQMDDVLLRKIEELTLYIIEQQKLIEQLQEKVEQLESK